MRKETNKDDRRDLVTIKHHVLLTLSGCVVASEVTASDLPILTRLTKMAPMGNGYLPASTVA